MIEMPEDLPKIIKKLENEILDLNQRLVRLEISDRFSPKAHGHFAGRTSHETYPITNLTPELLHDQFLVGEN